MSTMYPSKKSAAEDEELATMPSQSGLVDDPVFGTAQEDGPDYRSVGWLAASILMMKTEVGIGVLSIPQAFDSLGMIPGVLVLLAVASITTWSAYVVGCFKLNHPEVYGIADVGTILFGRPGRELLSVAFCLLWIFIAGSGILGLSIGLNAVSLHAACTAIFVAVAAVIGFTFASVRTLGKMQWVAWVGMASVLGSVLTLTIAVGVQNGPADEVQAEIGATTQFQLWGDCTFAEGMAAVSSIIFAFCGPPAYLPIVSEMADPRQYPKSLAITRSMATATYLIIGVVVYYYCGSNVASPALGSAGALMKRICYGLALPGLIVSTVLHAHLTSKYIFIRLLQGTKHLTSNTPTHWLTWLSCTSGTILIAYCIASGIPQFSALVSLVGAIFGTFMSFHPMACMWLYDNWNRSRTTPWYLKTAWACFVLLAGTFLMVAGTYGSVVGLVGIFDGGEAGVAAWSCADNSNSV